MEAIKTTRKHRHIGPLSKHGHLNLKIPRQTSSATTSCLTQVEMRIMMCKHGTRLPLKCPKTTVILFHFLLTSCSGSYRTSQWWSFSELIDDKWYFSRDSWPWVWDLQIYLLHTVNISFICNFNNPSLTLCPCCIKFSAPFPSGPAHGWVAEALGVKCFGMICIASWEFTLKLHNAENPRK